MVLIIMIFLTREYRSSALSMSLMIACFLLLQVTSLIPFWLLYLLNVLDVKSYLNIKWNLTFLNGYYVADGSIRIWRDYTQKGQQKLVTAFSSIQGHKPGVRSLNAVVDWQQQSGYLVCAFSWGKYVTCLIHVFLY